MYHDRQDLAALIGSRICHDLISPLGAISNGLELLAMTGMVPGPELELIEQSVSNANSRIRFFRIAYGSSPEGGVISARELTSILQDYFSQSRLSLTWKPSQDLPRTRAKAGFLALQCLETALPYGGHIEVSLKDGALIFEATSEKLRALPELWDILEGKPAAAALQSAHVQFGMLAQLAPQIRCSVSEQAIHLQI